MKALGPKYRVSFCSGENQSEERIAGRDFRLDHRCLAEFFFAKLPPLLDDLLRLAASVYVIDRLSKRRLKEDRRSWPRRLRASVEVLEPDFWNSSQVAPVLTESLEFISGDCWEITFEKGSPGQLASEEAFFPFTDPFVSDQPLVCLYSGGLDSAAGLVRLIRDCPGRPVIPVTVWHQPRQKSLVQRQCQIIKERCQAVLALWSSRRRWPGIRRRSKKKRVKGAGFSFSWRSVGSLPPCNVHRVWRFWNPASVPSICH